ncbi:winged helix-turn-helix transcriptional regulator [Niabella drilacis]|uniref:Transcriptional regulator, HxlR family n=1 Tax=Niabella drilacis (strain DSM 25811 / CCM 8410 / CCUG 62505 / LMG 26954 / E90) TaxID=1285928 RepID=A0A1G6S4Z5_NIADE|nr:helix-turn-helix domain-containing protein [Niabella drilacis]SDD11217.1 transcriptional regulator, HxlR family [Niabella drilacis]
MYTRKIPEDLDCGIVVTMKVLGGKWKACIVDSISKGVKRPSDLHRAIVDASPRVLNMQLHELENSGIVSKKIYPGLPLKVEYNLTPLGCSLLPVIEAIDKWGIENSQLITHLRADVREV